MGFRVRIEPRIVPRIGQAAHLVIRGKGQLQIFLAQGLIDRVDHRFVRLGGPHLPQPEQGVAIALQGLFPQDRQVHRMDEGLEIGDRLIAALADPGNRLPGQLLHPVVQLAGLLGRGDFERDDGFARGEYLLPEWAVELLKQATAVDDPQAESARLIQSHVSRQVERLLVDFARLQLPAAHWAAEV